MTIVRPSWIVGDRVTGEVGRPIGLYRLLLPLVRLARLPRALRVVPVVPGGSNRRADAVPVDWVVDAIEAMLADPTATGTFHLTSPDAPTVRELLAQVGDHFGGMTLGPDVPLTSPRGRIAGATTGATFDTSNASRILRPLGLEAPILQDYLAPILEYARRHLV